MTGRPSSVLDDHVTTPLPVPYEEDKFQSPGAVSLMNSETQKGSRNPASVSPSITGSTPTSDRSRSASKPENSRSPSFQQYPELDWARGISVSSSLYFLHYVQLARVSQEILNRVYTPNAVLETWSTIQKRIADLDGKVESWLGSLPTAFDFKRKQRDREFLEHRLSLGFFYYSTRMTLNRPCLCRLERRIPDQSAQALDSYRNSAAICIESAQEMLRLIPDEPNAVGLNRIGPWWSILHYLMQAAMVLMLELSFRAHHMPEQAENILEASKKAVRWLHQMGQESESAQRAWQLCNSLLRDVAPKIGRDVNDLPSQPRRNSTQLARSRFKNSTAMNGNGIEMMASFRPHFQAAFNPFLPSNPPFLPFTGYDQFYPYDHTMTEPATDHFPVVAEVEFMSHANHDERGQPFITVGHRQN